MTLSAFLLTAYGYYPGILPNIYHDREGTCCCPEINLPATLLRQLDLVRSFTSLPSDALWPYPNCIPFSCDFAIHHGRIRFSPLPACCLCPLHPTCPWGRARATAAAIDPPSTAVVRYNADNLELMDPLPDVENSTMATSTGGRHDSLAHYAGDGQGRGRP